MSLPIYKATEAKVTTFCILAEASVATNVENLGEVSVAIVAEASVAIAVEANVATDQKKQSRRWGMHAQVHFFKTVASILI